MINVICNKCGNEPKYGNFVSVNYQYGYGTVRDGSRVSFELCEECLTRFMNSFARAEVERR